MITICVMLFLHVFVDFNLQGWMGNGKQIVWWKENAPDKKYRFDWLAVLILHSFSWSFAILLPLIFCGITNIFYLILLISNTAVHAYVDDLKANRFKINLIVDQAIHIIQIFLSYFFLTLR